MSDFPPPGYIPASTSVPGIEVYMPAPPAAQDHQPVVEFTCPRCGASTAFSAGERALVCAHCGFSEAPQTLTVGKQADEFEFSVSNLEEAGAGWGEARKEMACSLCGAVVSVSASSLAHTCAFCGSNKVIQRQEPQDLMRPRFLIPFSINNEHCQKIALNWLGSSWMTPAGLSKAAKLERFSAIFLPYWTFDAHTQADWKAEVGHTVSRQYYENGERKQRTEIDWRWESGQAAETIDDLLVPGSKDMSPRLLSSVQNFDLTRLVAYEAGFLAGLQAQAYSVDLEAAWEIGRQKMREITRKACLAQASTSMVRNFSMELDFADESWRYILLPVYLSAYPYQGKVYQVLVNGQTGAIAGQRPVDWNKFWLVIAAILSPGLLSGLFGLVTLPLGGMGAGLAAFGLFLLVIGCVIGIVLFVQAQKLDDV